MRCFLFIGILFSFFNGFSQTSNKKRVLVIPYGRFEFASDFSLEEIAAKNAIEPPLVFEAYQKAILKEFDFFENENFEFISVGATAIKPYKKFIKYMDGKFEGRNHYAVNIKQFPVANFNQLMEAYDASFIVFVNWYRIKKQSYVSKGQKRKRYTYSSHFVDYEIYNLFREKLFGVGKQKIEVEEPTEKEATFALLRLSDLAEGYQEVITTVIEVLNNPIKKK